VNRPLPGHVQFLFLVIRDDGSRFNMPLVHCSDHARDLPLLLLSSIVQEHGPASVRLPFSPMRKLHFLPSRHKFTECPRRFSSIKARFSSIRPRSPEDRNDKAFHIPLSATRNLFVPAYCFSRECW